MTFDQRESPAGVNGKPPERCFPNFNPMPWHEQPSLIPPVSAARRWVRSVVTPRNASLVMHTNLLGLWALRMHSDPTEALQQSRTYLNPTVINHYSVLDRIAIVVCSECWRYPLDEPKNNRYVVLRREVPERSQPRRRRPVFGKRFEIAAPVPRPPIQCQRVIVV